jgi:hypothetical protein
MSQNPKGRTEDTKKAAEKNIMQAEPPLDKQDPTRPVKADDAPSGKKGKPANDPHVPL